jgi:hypothetical protein
MNIIINEGPDTRISMMTGQQLTLNNDPGKGLFIKIGTPLATTLTLEPST